MAQSPLEIGMTESVFVSALLPSAAHDSFTFAGIRYLRKSFSLICIVLLPPAAFPQMAP